MQNFANVVKKSMAVDKVVGQLKKNLSYDQIKQDQANISALNADDETSKAASPVAPTQFTGSPITDSDGNYLTPIQILLNRLKKVSRRFPNNTFNYEFFNDGRLKNNLKPNLLPIQITRMKKDETVIELNDTYEDFAAQNINDSDESPNTPSPYLIFADENELFHANLDPALPSTETLLKKLLVEYYLDDLIFKNEEYKSHIENGLADNEKINEDAKINKRTENRKLILSLYKNIPTEKNEQVTFRHNIHQALGINADDAKCDLIRSSLFAFNSQVKSIMRENSEELLKRLDCILKTQSIHYGWSSKDKFENQLNYRKTMIAFLAILFFVEFGIFNNAPGLPYIEDKISPQASNILQLLLSTGAVFLHVYKWHNKIQTHSYHSYQNTVTTKGIQENQNNNNNSLESTRGCLIIGDAEKKDLDTIYKEGKVVAAQTALLGVVVSILLGFEPMNWQDNKLKMLLGGVGITAVSGILNGCISYYAHKEERPTSHHFKMGTFSGFATAVALVLIYPVRMMGEDETFNFGNKIGTDISLDPQLTVLRGLCLLFAAALCFVNRNEMHAIKSVDDTYAERSKKCAAANK